MTCSKNIDRMADKMGLFNDEKTPDEDNSMNDSNAENDGKIFAILFWFWKVIDFLLIF